MPKTRIFLLGAAGLIILVLILMLVGAIPGLKGPGGGEIPPVSLNVWGVFLSPVTMGEIAANLPGFVINYRELDPATYEADLVNALAAGKGPDVFMIHSSWVPKHYEKLAPISTSQLGISSLRDLYPTVVEQDFGPDAGAVYALPVYLDTLTMLYNKNIFDQKGISLPPSTWTEFQEIIPKIRETDSAGRLVRPAAAIGGSNKNINRATDILSALMLQSGVKMTAADFSKATFAESGKNSLLFYAKFANPASEFYTWNATQENSLDSFAKEETAIIFNYQYQLRTLREKNPFLEIGIAPLPQPSKTGSAVNYANYWGLAVSNRAPNQLGAWNFVWNLSGNASIAKTVAEKTGRLPALRSLIAERESDPLWSVFAKQALTARSWPQIDNNAVDEAFSKTIDDVLDGVNPSKALQEAETAVTELMERKKSSF